MPEIHSHDDKKITLLQCGNTPKMHRMALDRKNQSWLARWWWTVDRPLFYGLMALLVTGSILVTAGSPPVAERLGLNSYYFVHRHQIFLGLGFVVMFMLSLLSIGWIRRLAMLGFAGSLILMVLVPIFGAEANGAHRWISLGGFSLQPSEFMKPTFAVTMAWVVVQRFKSAEFPSYRLAVSLFALVVLLLAVQPDFGMIMTVTAMWCIQLFMAGLPFIWVLILSVMTFGGVGVAYMVFPHVKRRIDMFLDPSAGDNYQVEKSLEAFQSGRILGKGPGEGVVKQHLPDSHTDFVFSVAGEEFGMIACMVIAGLFAFIVLRALMQVWHSQDMFVLVAVVGLAAQFGIQSAINMGVAVSILPAKGMTLPFLSYGGSSVIAIALGMGMLLALTRRRYGVN